MDRKKKKLAQWDSHHVLQLRQQMGLTQRELADKLGTRQQTISEWEKGMYAPRGTSSRLLSIVAEQAHYSYQAGPLKKNE